MKKYNLLGHLFELEPRAHDFLERYVQRIESYATSHDISKDILEDIKYNIIEKLYTAQSPINEAFVMNLAETIGEPEQIFENKDTDQPNDYKEANLLNKYLGKDKPMIWGVAYRIAKSLNISVSSVRLLFLIAVFIYGTSIWLYPLLALFVPFKDKKSTTGATGNMFFEVIRVIIWLGVTFFLAASIFGSTVGLTILSVLPTLSNQSLQAIIPFYLYPLAIVALASGIILLIGALGALIKKNRVSKTVALISIVIIIGSIFTAGIAGFSTMSKYNYNPKSIDTQTVGTLTTDEDTIIINLNSDQNITQGNYFGNFFGGEFGDPAIFQTIELLPSEDNETRVEIVDSTNILQKDNPDQILSKRSQVTTVQSGNTIDITIPNNIFSQKVPFSFAQRTVNIYVPTDKTIQYNNHSQLRYNTPHTWYEYDDKDYPEKVIYCDDTTSFTYYESYSDWRCTHTTFSKVNEERSTSYDDPLTQNLDQGDNSIGFENLTPDEEDIIEKTYIGLPITQATTQATASGMILRVVKEDGIDLPRTEDYRPGRINVEINKGIITDLDIE